MGTLVNQGFKIWIDNILSRFCLNNNAFRPAKLINKFVPKQILFSCLRIMSYIGKILTETQ